MVREYPMLGNLLVAAMTNRHQAFMVKGKTLRKAYAMAFGYDYYNTTGMIHIS